MYMIYHRNVRMIMGIRILQEDVFNDKYDWCKEIKIMSMINIYSLSVRVIQLFAY